MIEKLITPGQKIELTEILMVDTDRKPKTYQSQVFDVHEDDDRLDIAMPIVAGRLIPLSVGLHFSVCFYTPKGLYQSNCVIVDRYKSNNLYTIVIELKTAPKKYQRRQFYRLETILPLKYILLEEAELRPIEVLKKVPENDKFPPGRLLEGNTLDISGGGMKFISDMRLDKGRSLIIEFSLPINMTMKKIRMTVKVIESVQSPNKKGFFQHRAEYDLIGKDDREMLIKYIFEEERKMRNKERM